MKLKLLLGLHSHQPLGNFDYVFREAFEKAYGPFIDLIEEYPDFKVTLHYTGPLLLWFRKNVPGFLGRLRKLVERGQVEIVISGFYEPVLLVIPEEDRVAQIKMAQRFVREELGAEARGLWLTERVWESELLRALTEAKIEYVLVDDFHFLSAGLTENQLHGYYLTESEGKIVKVFPIDEKLRYLIPFRKLEEVFSYMRSVLDKGGEAAVIFDDGEKFGLWPGTHDWVYKNGWLREFIESVLSTDWIETATYSEFVENHRPKGRIYLPSNSYFEMGEWSLPAERALEFRRLIDRLKRQGIYEGARGFLRGGIYKNFLVKYTEANRMHKKMLLLRRDVKVLTGDRKVEALDYIYRAQCNDAYWHGIFGGLYLPHLRREVYRNLLMAEKLLTDRRSIDVADIDADGEDEIYIRDYPFVMQFKPSCGGAMVELSYLKLPLNLMDTLKRRFEHYHEGLHVEDGVSEGVASIHEIPKRVDEKTYRALVYDECDRFSLLDKFFREEPKAEELMYNRAEVVTSFVRVPYSFGIAERRINLESEGQIGDTKVRLSKEIHWEDNKIAFNYVLENSGEATLNPVIFGSEFNLALPSPGAEGTFIEVNGVKLGTTDLADFKDVEKIRIRDTLGLVLSITVESNPGVHIYPVYTVSQSEKGFDLTYQETCLVFTWRLELRPSEEIKYQIVFSFDEEGG